jgi:periplasmic protein CpxP/Spy
MNKRILAIAFIAALVSISPHALHAVAMQDQAEPSASTAAPTPDEVVKMLDSRLSLTDDQKSQITPIIAERQAKLKELRDDTSARPMRRARRAKKIFEESDKKIKAILTPDQQQKYAELEQEMREHMKQRMQQRQNGTSN